eukprot:1739204-Rhodomonas_salina.2
MNANSSWSVVLLQQRYAESASKVNTSSHDLDVFKSSRVRVMNILGRDQDMGRRPGSGFMRGLQETSP